MELNSKIYEVFADEADRSVIDEVHLGLGYTAITLVDGRCGICASLCDPKHAFTVNTDGTDYEGRAAIQMLRNIKEENHLKRVMAIALVNALNQPFANVLPEGPADFHKEMELPEGAKVAMIGHFTPIFEMFEERGFEVRSLDLGKGIGDPEKFYPWATTSADALVLTATCVVNNTLEQVLARFSKRIIPVVLMGPSTIMRKEVYEDLPINYLAGSAVMVKKDLLKAVRNGRGTLDIHRQAKKVFLKVK